MRLDNGTVGKLCIAVVTCVISVLTTMLVTGVFQESKYVLKSQYIYNHDLLVKEVGKLDVNMEEKWRLMDLKIERTNEMLTSIMMEMVHQKEGRTSSGTRLK